MSSDRLYSPLPGSPRSSTPRPATKARASSRWGGLRHLLEADDESGVGERAERPAHRPVAAEAGARVPRRVVERQGERRPRPLHPVSERLIRVGSGYEVPVEKNIGVQDGELRHRPGRRRESDGEEREAGGPQSRPAALQDGVAAEQGRDDRDPARVGGVGVDAQAEGGPGDPPFFPGGVPSDRPRANRIFPLGLWFDKLTTNGRCSTRRTDLSAQRRAAADSVVTRGMAASMKPDRL